MSLNLGYRGLSALSLLRTAATGGGRVASFARTTGASVLVDSALQELLDEDLIASAISGVFPESEASSDVARIAISLAAYGIVSLGESGLKKLRRPKGLGQKKPLSLKDVSDQSSTFGGSEISRSNAVLRSISKGDGKKLVSLSSGSGMIAFNKKKASSIPIGVGASVVVGDLISQMADVASGITIEISISGTEKERKTDLTSIAVCIDDHEFLKVYETGKFMTECGLLDSATISKAAGYLTPLLLNLEYETWLNIIKSGKGSYDNNVWTSDVPGFVSAINMLENREAAFAACDSVELVCSAALLCAIESPEEVTSDVEYSVVDVEASSSALCKCVPVSDSETLDLLNGYVSKLQLEVSILTDRVTTLEKENSLRSGLIPERLGSDVSSPQRGENLRKKKDSKEFQESIPVVNKFIEKYGFLQLFENPRSLADLIISETGYTRQKAREAVVFAIGSLFNR